MTASEEEEEIPAAVTRVAEDVIAKPLDAVAEQLSQGPPPGKWPALRRRVEAAIPGYDMVHLPIEGDAGRHWRSAKDNTYIALGLLDAMISPDGFKNLRMAWGKTYGTLEQIANRSEPERAAAIREKALTDVKAGIDLIPAIETEEDPQKLLDIRAEGAEVEATIEEVCGDDPLAFAAMQQFRLGLEILRLAVLPENESLNVIAGWLDRAVFDVTHLDEDPDGPYPPSGADDGDTLPPPQEVAPPPGPQVAPSPNPLPPPPPPPPT